MPPPEVPPAVELPAAEEYTYGQILKSSALIGGSSLLNIGIGIVRTKGWPCCWARLVRTDGPLRLDCRSGLAIAGMGDEARDGPLTWGRLPTR